MSYTGGGSGGPDPRGRLFNGVGLRREQPFRTQAVTSAGRVKSVVVSGHSGTDSISTAATVTE